MKGLVIVLLVALNTLISFAGKPPDAVNKAFNQKFPNAQKVRWGKENSTVWEAEFTLNEVKISANFSADGLWLETETEISTSQLPENVMAAIKLKFQGYSIVGASKVESKESGLLYEADLKSGLRKKEVLYKVDGTFVK